MMEQVFQLDTTDERPIFRQLSDQIIRRINAGRLRPGTRLMSTRALAKALGINRKTVIAAYDDVADQGYLSRRIGSGYWVSDALPQRMEYHPAAITEGPANFAFDGKAPSATQPTGDQLRLTEGAPDVRLADLGQLYAAARRHVKRASGQRLTRYGDGQGDLKLREVLSDYLGSSRGIPVPADNILLTRGSQHGFQLASRLLFRGGGCLAVAQLSYEPILVVAQDFGAEIIRIPLDEHGMIVEAIAQHPRISEIKAVYVTPHHQYPTTVTMPPERRMQLLDLAAQYQFAILEDDYDYDFHYERPPLLPLAALDRFRNVIYLGSFTKILAPTFRVGYLIGPQDFVTSALYHRLLTDRQGDPVLERALAYFITDGELERHLRKVRPIYQHRRDVMSRLLNDAFGERISFELPSGGMALWATFKPALLSEPPASCSEVWISPSHQWWRSSHSLRLGFASLNEEELKTAIDYLKTAVLAARAT
ncbi:MAG: PLP-dependent aminotransferase family protein [Bacteroidota bacterium]